LYADQRHVFRRAFHVPVKLKHKLFLRKDDFIIQADTTATASVV